MTTLQTGNALSRRTALAGLGAGGFALALAARGAAAQEATPNDLSGHPQVGVWMIESPIGRAIAVYAADGSVITALTPSAAGPGGVAFSSTQIGTWEATGERSTHITVVHLLSDAAGASTGSVTIDAYQEIGEDGQSWTSVEGSSGTIRDANHNILDVLTGGDLGTAVGTRMGVGAPGFPEASATPTA